MLIEGGKLVYTYIEGGKRMMITEEMAGKKKRKKQDLAAAREVNCAASASSWQKNAGKSVPN